MNSDGDWIHRCAWLPLVFIAGLTPLQAAPPITAAAFAPGGDSVFIGSQAGVEVRSWPSLKLTRRIDVDIAHVHDLAFSPRGDILAIAGGAPRQNGRVILYGWPNNKLIEQLDPHDDLVYSFAWRGDAGDWATGGGDTLVSIHDSGGKAQFRGHSRAVLAVAGLPNSNLLLSGGRDQSLRVWDTASGELVRTLDNHTADVYDIAVRPNTEGLPMVASAGADHTVRLWQPAIGRMVRFARLESPPLAIDWTQGGDRLLASCADGHLRIVDPDTVAIIADKPAIDGWAYVVLAAPDGRTALVGGERGQLQAVSLSASN